MDLLSDEVRCPVVKSFGIEFRFQVWEPILFLGKKLGGKLKAMGSFRSGKNLETGSNISVLGAASIGGNILTESDVKVKGSVSVSENIYANNVTLGRKRWWNIFGIKQGSDRPYKISGAIISKNGVDIRGTVVKNDVKGQDVHIRKYSEVQGQIYYKNSIKVHRKAKTKGEPIKISEEK